MFKIARGSLNLNRFKGFQGKVQTPQAFTSEPGISTTPSAGGATSTMGSTKRKKKATGTVAGAYSMLKKKPASKISTHTKGQIASLLPNPGALQASLKNREMIG